MADNSTTNILSYNGILTIKGQNSEKFLQGQITLDAKNITSEPKLSAICNRHGKIITIFSIYRADNIYYLNMPKNLVPVVIKYLGKYAQFYPEINLSDQSELATNPTSQLDRLKKLIPAIYPTTSNIFFCHELNLINRNAVSLTKGCYTGQEIIARMYYKGKQKTKLILAKYTDKYSTELGKDIFSEENVICGRIVDAEKDQTTNTWYLLIIIPINYKDNLYIKNDQTGEKIKLIKCKTPGY